MKGEGAATFEYQYSNLYYAHTEEELPGGKDGDFARMCYPFYELVYLARGQVEFVTGSRRHVLKAGDLLMLQPRTGFFIRQLSRERPERYTVRFTEYLVPRDLLPSLGRMDGVYHMGDTPIPQLFRRMDWHHATVGDRPVTLKLLFRCVLTEILVYFCHLAPTPSAGVNVLKEDMTAVLEFINRNLEEPLCLDDICREFHYSKSYVCREFSLCMGMPIMQYIREKKILYADALLRSGMPPTVTARQCGFANYSTFYRLYKRKMGRPPSARGPEDAPEEI